MFGALVVQIILARQGIAGTAPAFAATPAPTVAHPPIAAPMFVMVVVGLVGIVSIAIRIPQRIGVFRVWIGRLRAESDGLIVRRLSEKVLRMRERVGYSAGASR